MTTLAKGKNGPRPSISGTSTPVQPPLGVEGPWIGRWPFTKPAVILARRKDSTPRMIGIRSRSIRSDNAIFREMKKNQLSKKKKLKIRCQIIWWSSDLPRSNTSGSTLPSRPQGRECGSPCAGGRPFGGGQLLGAK